jgi:hypothetical protein
MFKLDYFRKVRENRVIKVNRLQYSIRINGNSAGLDRFSEQTELIRKYFRFWPINFYFAKENWESKPIFGEVFKRYRAKEKRDKVSEALAQRLSQRNQTFKRKKLFFLQTALKTRKYLSNQPFFRIIFAKTQNQ